MYSGLSDFIKDISIPLGCCSLRPEAKMTAAALFILSNLAFLAQEKDWKKYNFTKQMKNIYCTLLSTEMQ